jgi:predicted negative regulator of RcsB-dependent stress response
MASKKRRFEQLQAAAATAPQQKKTYVDPFQQQVVPRIEDFGKRFEGKGRTILYAIGGLIAVIIVAAIIMSISRGSNTTAQAALGKAIETSQAQITDNPLTVVGQPQKTYKTEKERSEAAIAQFQEVVDKYGGAVGEKAKYFIAVNKLYVDRPAAIQELEGMAKSDSEVGKLARFALAHTRFDDNRLDDALALYQELDAMSDPIVAKDSIKFEIARIYEKQGKKQEAVDAYFNIAKAAADAKDRDGKPEPMTQTATEAKDKVKELDPEKAKEIPEPTPTSPFGD